MCLGYLFVDMNAYYASVEQMDRPALAGRAVAVTPVLADSGCCIACSYEARAAGVRTGCSVKQARQRCAEIEVVQARMDRYIEVHHAILAAVDRVLPVSRVESVDEFWVRLLSNERSPARARRLALAVKSSIRAHVGRLTCSVGVGPNRFIAKVATELEKPDGLVMIQKRDLPGPLLDLELTDLPGINRGIRRRLRSASILTVADLYSRSPAQLRQAWQSVLGVYWWHWIRGDDVMAPESRTKTVGHQHVLAPEFRAPGCARGVATRLLAKATQRMRTLGFCATRLRLDLSTDRRTHWSDWSPFEPTDDTIELGQELVRLWAAAPLSSESRVFQVGVRLEGLIPEAQSRTLFTDGADRRALMQSIDRINRKHGSDAVYLASMHNQRKTAPRRIPFGKPPDLDLPDYSV